MAVPAACTVLDRTSRQAIRYYVFQQTDPRSIWHVLAAEFRRRMSDAGAQLLECGALSTKEKAGIAARASDLFQVVLEIDPRSIVQIDLEV